MNPRAVWSFIAGDSLRAPLGVALAVVAAAGLVRFAPFAGGWIGAFFVAAIAASFVAGVFERTP